MKHVLNCNNISVDEFLLTMLISFRVSTVQGEMSQLPSFVSCFAFTIVYYIVVPDQFNLLCFVCVLPITLLQCLCVCYRVILLFSVLTGTAPIPAPSTDHQRRALHRGKEEEGSGLGPPTSHAQFTVGGDFFLDIADLL